MWSEETRASFASDPFWQEAIERRKREKQESPGGEILAAVNGLGMRIRDGVCTWADVGLEWAVGQSREVLRGEFEKRGWTAELVDRLPPPPDPWGLASAGAQPEHDETYQLDEADSFAGWLETQGIYGSAND
jgi:hypothetical protein